MLIRVILGNAPQWLPILIEWNSGRPFKRCHDALIFANGNNLVGFHLSETLDLLCRRPFDLDKIGSVGDAESKMEAEIALRHHTRATVYLIYL